MFRYRIVLPVLFMMVFLGLLAGCRKTQSPQTTMHKPTARPSAQPTAPPEKAVAPEKNPPGDIPDTQVFITYKSRAGKYELDVPEGWARTEHGSDVKFTDKFDGEQVTLSKAATTPTVTSVQKVQIPELQQRGRVVKAQSVKSKKMPNGMTTVYVIYTSNSDPDPVTGKQVRLDNVTYYFYRPGTLATLRLWAPSGADNADQWKRISESFRWL